MLPAATVATSLLERPAGFTSGPRRSGGLRIKRCIDVALTSLLLLLGAVPLLLIAVAVELSSPGPALIVQPRHGLNGRVFPMYKFRTMFHDRCDAAGLQQATMGDPRVTPLGRWLRKWSLDELPQLYNVMAGEMSLVGPRPHPVGLRAAGRPYDELVPYYHLRHAVKPGITGLAQCNGLRGPTDDPELARARIEHDVAYVQDFSLLLDARIMLKTLIRELPSGSGI